MSGERGVGILRAGILRAGSKNYRQNFRNTGFLLKIEILNREFFKISIFGENWDLLPWIRKTLEPS
jgi:hypothetical protein